MTDFLVKPILAGLFMAAILSRLGSFRSSQALPVAAAAGVAYLAALFLLRTFSKDELRLMREEGLSVFVMRLAPSRSPRQLEGQALRIELLAVQ